MGPPPHPPPCLNVDHLFPGIQASALLAARDLQKMKKFKDTITSIGKKCVNLPACACACVCSFNGPCSPVGVCADWAWNLP